MPSAEQKNSIGTKKIGLMQLAYCKEQNRTIVCIRARQGRLVMVPESIQLYFL